MGKQSSLLQIEQVKNNELLKRLIIYDGDVAYDVVFGEKGSPLIRMMFQNEENKIFYEGASKKKGKPCEHKYQTPYYRCASFDGETGESITYAQRADGTVRGGLTIAPDLRGFRLFCGEGKWLSFSLTPQGVRYILDPEVDLGIQPTTAGVDRKLPVVLIDGKETLPMPVNEMQPVGGRRPGGRD